jgi:hypothetical protein
MKVAMRLGGAADSSVRMSAMVRPLPPPGSSTDDTSWRGTSRRSSCARRCKLRYSAADARIVSVDRQFFTSPRKTVQALTRSRPNRKGAAFGREKKSRLVSAALPLRE